MEDIKVGDWVTDDKYLYKVKFVISEVIDDYYINRVTLFEPLNKEVITFERDEFNKKFIKTSLIPNFINSKVGDKVWEFGFGEKIIEDVDHFSKRVRVFNSHKSFTAYSMVFDYNYYKHPILYNSKAQFIAYVIEVIGKDE